MKGPTLLALHHSDNSFLFDNSSGNKEVDFVPDFKDIQRSRSFSCPHGQHCHHSILERNGATSCLKNHTFRSDDFTGADQPSLGYVTIRSQSRALSLLAQLPSWLFAASLLLLPP